MYNRFMNFLYLEEIESTNKYAKEHIADINNATVIYTSNQTAGRGRLSRTWNNTGAQNIYASIVLKPSTVFKDVYTNLTQYLCLILSEVMEEYDVKPKIKWPNDIRIDGKKISGILAEAVANSDGLQGLILGFGVNLNCKSEDILKINQAATSLNLEIGKNIDRDLFLRKVIDKFCLRYNKFIEEGFLFIRDDYVRRAEFLNMPVTVKVFDKEISGIAKDITENGALKIVDKDNKEHVLLIGDIL